MISLVGTRPAVSKKFTRDQKTHVEAVRAIAVGYGRVKSDAFKGRELWGEFKSALVPRVDDVPRRAKCAYCERERDHSELNVDHRRPKAAVEEWSYPDWETTSVVETRERRHDGPSSAHPGYWWLAYDWTNYALACWQCNGHWKKNLFPVDGTRAEPDGDLAAEKPLLLDPYSDFESDDHFTWDRAGLVSPQTRAARATILVCGLNRCTLVAQRLEHIQRFLPVVWRFKNACRSTSRAPLSFVTLARETLAYGEANAPFAAMCRWMIWDAVGRPERAHWAQLRARWAP